ncbi:MAG: LysE family translocator [Candidatus Eiseniibacteriota bacterium]
MIPGTLGFGLGFVGSMPIAGPVSLLVAERGVAARYRDGFLLACGAAVAEAGYCAAALYGYDFLLDRWPPLRPLLSAIGALLLIALGIHFIRRRRPRAEGHAPSRALVARSHQAALGFTLVVLNPSVLVSWLAVLAALHATGLKPEGASDRLLFVAGVGLGIVTWFGGLLAMLRRGRERMSPVVLDRMVRALGGVLCAVGLYTLYARFF